jgi:hypothetical protein
MRLISYSETPQVTALEYAEMRDLKEHPGKIKHYAKLIEKRTSSKADFLTGRKRKKRKA